MLRDEQPRYQLGFGVTSDSVNVESAPDPNSSMVSKALHEHPVMRFFAATAATMVGSHLAGRLIARGGKRLAATVSERAIESEPLTRLIKEARDVQSMFDEWEGIVRQRGRIQRDGQDLIGPKGQTYDDLAGDEINRDTVGFWATKAEREKAARIGVESDSEWTMRHEIQRRMVRAARRLPYELPAGYIIQRAVVDPVFGTNQEDKPTWYNPIDVIGDFAEQSVKNAAGLLAFEGIAGAASHTFNRARFPGVAYGTETPFEKRANKAFVDADTSLRLIGHKASDIFHEATRVASRTGTSFNAGIQEAIRNSRTIPENVNTMLNKASRKSRQGKFDVETAQDIASNIPGFFGRLTPFYTGFKRSWKETAGEEWALRGTGGTRLEDFAESIEGLTGHGDIMTSPFAREEVNSHYKHYVKEYFVNELKIDADAADEALTRLRFKAPRIKVENNVASVSARVAKGNVSLGEDFFEDRAETIVPLLTKRMRDINGGDKIAQNIDEVIRATDQRLADNYDVVKSTINKKWQATRDLVGKHSADTFNQRKMDYDLFGKAPDNVIKDYLVTRSAQSLGISLQANNAAGIRKLLAERGIDANDVYQMRGFLTQRGLINKPGSSGFNLFGLRKLSAEDAMARGYFGSTDPQNMDPSARRVKNLLGLMDNASPIDRRLRATTFGHVYETSSGKIVDLASPLGSVKKALDSLATEYKIPVINIKPLNLFGWDVGMKMRNTPGIQYSGGYNRHPFTGSYDNPDRRDAYLWFRNRGSKGRLYRTSYDGRSDPVDLGTYRPMTTSESSLAGKTLRHAIGNKGNIPDRARGRFGSAFDVDEDQPESLLRGFRRFRNRKQDLFNEVTLARKLIRGEIDFDNYTSRSELAEAAQMMFGKFRASGLSPSAAKAMPESFMDGDLSPDQLLRTRNAAQTRDLLSRINETEQARINSLSGEAKRSQQSVFNNLVRGHLDDSTGKIDSLAPQVNYSATIHRTQDIIKNDLLQYSMISKALTKPGANIDQEFANMMEHLATLKANGSISGKEFIETQTALLSTQLNFAAVRMGTQTAQEKLISQLQMLQGPKYLVLKNNAIATSAALNDVAAGKTARFGKLGAFLKQNFGTSSYRYPGDQYNPFGTTTAFVPTFGTAFNRDPLGALASVSGLNTYRNPGAFSGSSIPVAHSVQRMNRYFSALGMGIDETQYRGPLDLFARGMVGKRVLPITAAGATFMAVDRELGATVYGRDEYGDKQYKPLITGAVARGVAESQIAMAGIVPGGQSAKEKREELYLGEVPVRKGRWWLLGSTPWRGGNEQYFRPSWYRRFMSGYMYDKEYGFDSPLEKLAFGYDFSPLRPLDPYRFERNTMHSRPYPTTGEYFTGPWGPLNPVLNATLGRILKPQQLMHEEELKMALSEGFQPSGQYGATVAPSSISVQTQLGRTNDLYESAGTAVNRTAAAQVQGSLGGANAYYSRNSNASYSASRRTKSDLARTNAGYEAAGGIGFGKIARYDYVSKVIPNQPAINTGSVGYQSGAFGYRTQEMLGIYGFTAGTIRESLGMGDRDYMSNRPVLASAGKAYGTSRSFWDLNLGGFGDFQTPIDTGSNLEISELIRRFIPKSKDINEINPLRNDLGMMYPWLPGPGSVRDFHHGDPYTQIPEGEMRLPGPGYEKLHRLHPDYSGKYGMRDRFAILGDVAPWSNQFKMMQRQMINMGLGDEKGVQETIRQAAAVNQKHDFKPYQHEGISRFTPAGVIEWLRHRDTYFNRKLIPDRTATEDWERNHVYGTEFAEWQHPIQDFLKPMLYKSTTRNPIISALGGSAVGAMFGGSPRGRVIGSFIGAGIGFGSGFIRGSEEVSTGSRFLPADYKKQLAIEEYVDILSYLKNRRSFEQAKAFGDQQGMKAALRGIRNTMYGADIENASAEDLSFAVPKNKREHFLAMLQAPKSERKRILSTAGRLERRLYEAAWGQKVEKRPDLGEYFSEHELPPADSEFWTSPESMDDIKIKILQSMNLNPKQAGYFPQEIQRANLRNPVYPEFGNRDNRQNVQAQLEQILRDNGISGSVTRTITPYPSNQIVFNSGILR